jgi:hypothetical protein
LVNSPGSQSRPHLPIGVLVAASAAAALLVMHAMRDKAPKIAPATAVLPPWGGQSKADGIPSGVGYAPDAQYGHQAAAPGDNASDTDGAPPIAPEVASVWSVPIPTIPSLAAEHMPETPTWSRPVTGLQDVAALRYRIETLLVSDPEALRQANALLDEVDPQIRAQNLDVLADSFGLD